MRFCIVNSGRGPTNKEIDEIADAVREIREKTGMNICCSLGLMSEEKIQRLKEVGVGRVNHNLNTSRNHHPDIVTTHSYDDRVATIENVKHAGVGTCSGGIIGMGESDEDIIDLALTLRAMDIESIPVNFLNSIPKTPFEKKSRAYAAALPENALSFSFRESAQGDPRRRRQRSEFALFAAAQFVSGKLDLRQRLSHHARTGSLRRASNDSRSRLRARSAGGDLVFQYAADKYRLKQAA